MVGPDLMFEPRFELKIAAPWTLRGIPNHNALPGNIWEINYFPAQLELKGLIRKA